MVIAPSGQGLTPLRLFRICSPILYGAVILAWFIIEKPALSLKPRRPRHNQMVVDQRAT